MKQAEWLKEQGDQMAHPTLRYVVTKTLTSTNDDSEELISSNETLDAMTAKTAMEYSSVTCDTDMLMESYHHFSDDIVIVDADAAHICAADVAVVVPKDWLINLPLN